MKKIIIINLLLLCGICFCFGKNKKKYLVFSFYSRYEIEDYAHGTGDNLWVIPYDSCSSENLDKFRPLLIEEWAVDLATGPEAEFVRFGEDGKPHNMYRGTDVGFGGYIVSEAGIYENVALLDVASLHPHSIIAMNCFGEYTKHLKDILLVSSQLSSHLNI